MFGFNRSYVRDWFRVFAPTYLPGENYSFYFNCNEPIDDASFGGFQLWVVDPNSTQIVQIHGLARVFVAGIVGYDLYINDFVFPRIKDGYYQFQIWDSIHSLEMFRSNWIIVNSNCLYNTTPVKFRHNDKLYGFRYDLLPNFYQKFRLPITQIKAPEIQSIRDQYRQSSNGRELRNSKSFRDIILTLEMYWSDDDDYGALSAMLEHTEIYVSGNRVIDMSQVKTEKPTEFSRFNKGTFTVIVDDYDINTRDLDHYGEFILFGGNANNNLNTFVQG